jgi:hypothetical protein
VTPPADGFLMVVVSAGQVPVPVVAPGGGAGDTSRGRSTLRRLREFPRERWRATTLSSAAVPLDQLSVATADEPLFDVLQRSRAADGRVLVVDDCQRLVCVVTPTDVTTALEGRTLTRTLNRR